MKNRHWLLNILAVLTVIICLLAFTAHYKNWTKADTVGIKILSGFYYQELKFSELDSIAMIDRIPPMERLNGFSALQKGKGVYREFRDSLTDKKIYVFIDNFEHQKIRLVYNDSLKLYINLKDSIETDQLYQFLSGKLTAEPN